MRPLSAFALALTLTLTLTLTPTLVLAFDVPPNDGYVTDTAGILKPEEEQKLEQMLSAYQQESSSEIAVVIFQSLGGESIADAAVAIGRKWGVGGAENNNGILLLISYEDRKLFLATGYGLEGALPDIVAKGIIEQEITPHFRDGAYFEGIKAGIEAIEKHINGEYTAERYASSGGGGVVFPWFLFFVFIILNWFASVFARTKSWWLGGIVGGVLGMIYTFLFSWWYSIPLLVLIGLAFDYFVSKGGVNRARGGRWGGWGGGGMGGGEWGIRRIRRRVVWGRRSEWEVVR